MIFISTAMMSEARIFIDRLKLKMNKEENRFRIYENESIKLIITGVGATNAMIATVYLLTRYEAKKTDCLVNLGIAAIISTENVGGTEKFNKTINPEKAIPGIKNATSEDGLEFLEEENSFLGEIYLASSIENTIMKRSFYPDMILATEFAQSKVITVGEVYFSNKNSQNRDDYGDNSSNAAKLFYAKKNQPDLHTASLNNTNTPVLVEMEAAFIYEAAIGFIYSHNIFVLKIISDAGDPENLTPDKVTSLINLNMDKIEAFINLLCEWSHENSRGEIISNSEKRSIDEISKLLRLTQYQRIELLNLSEMYVIRGKNLKAALDSFIGISPVKQKQEGKESYGKIRKILLQP